MNRAFPIIFAFLTLIVSCKFKDRDETLKTKADKKVYENDSSLSILNSNKIFFRDSLLKDNSGVIDHYFSSYQSDTCGILTHKNSELKENFEGIRILKGIKINKQKDTVFVIPTFNYCEEGESYVFYDKTLPRLKTDSYCCQPDNLFVCQDIDEDGVNEIGIYYSTCVSRYKSLRIYSLKNDEWKEIGSSEFDVLTQDPSKINFNDLVKKTAKNEFKICNFIDEKTEWETIKMK